MRMTGVFKNVLYLQYEHHGNLVWVREDLKGMHQEYCECYDCVLFKPNTKENCSIAQENFELCKKNKTVQVMWECPNFEPKLAKTGKVAAEGE